MTQKRFWVITEWWNQLSLCFSRGENLDTKRPLTGKKKKYRQWVYYNIVAKCDIPIIIVCSVTVTGKPNQTGKPKTDPYSSQPRQERFCNHSYWYITTDFVQRKKRCFQQFFTARGTDVCIKSSHWPALCGQFYTRFPVFDRFSARRPTCLLYMFYSRGSGK